MVDRCDLTELPKVMCAHCLGHTEQQVNRPGQLGPWFDARYPGRCTNCGDYFDTGNRIRADGQGGYLGECCEGVHHG